MALPVPVMAEGETSSARLALRRLQLALPLLLVGVVVSLALSSPTGIALGRLVYVDNAVLLMILSGLYVAVLRGRVPLRHAHAAAGVVWLLLALNTLATLALNRDSDLVFLFLVELALALVLQADFVWLVATTAGAVGLWVPLCVLYSGSRTGIELSTVFGLLAIVWWLGFRLSRAMAAMLAEFDGQVEMSRALEYELEERERAQRERERLREQFIQAQRMEAAGLLAAGVAHDMNNILSGILGMSQLVAETNSDPALRADLAEIARQTERGANLTRSLLAFAQPGLQERRPARLAAVVDEVVPLLTRTLGKGITLVRTDSGAVVVDCDAAQIGQAVVNLCANGVDAMEENGTLTIATSDVTMSGARSDPLQLEAGRYAVLAITDTGRGIDEAVRSRLFEPFFTTKPPGKGTGLGLAMVYETVKAHGGAIEVESDPSWGTTFRIFLPTSSATVATQTPGIDRHPEPRARHEVVLVVDDEPMVRSIAARTLRSQGWSVAEAGNGDGALTVFAERQSIALVVLDLRMPGMSGAECFRRVRAMSDVPVLITSGFADDAELEGLLEQGATGFLGKPYRPKALIESVQTLLDRVSVPARSATP